MTKRQGTTALGEAGGKQVTCNRCVQPVASPKVVHAGPVIMPAQ